MKKIDEALQWIQSCCVDDVLSQFNIKVIHAPELNKTKKDSFLKIINRQSIIFIKTNLNENYEKFILYHEIGHFLMHYEEGMQYSFYLSRFKNRLEVEANIFACTCLLNDEYKEEVDIINLLQRKGVPEEIALQFYEHQYVY